MKAILAEVSFSPGNFLGSQLVGGHEMYPTNQYYFYGHF